jgi:hypothetical protein
MELNKLQNLKFANNSDHFAFYTAVFLIISHSYTLQKTSHKNSNLVNNTQFSLKIIAFLKSVCFLQ